jgi:hypothetical protein
MSGAPYSAVDAAVFAQLAGIANSDLSTSPPILPSGWALQRTCLPTFQGLQAYLATGAQPSSPSTTIAILAVGMQWLPLLNWYDITEHQLNPLPGYLVTGSSSAVEGRETAAHRAMRRLARVPRLAGEQLRQNPTAAREQGRLLHELLGALGEASGGPVALDELVNLCAAAAGAVDALIERGQRGRTTEPGQLAAYDRLVTALPDVLARTRRATTTAKTGAPTMMTGQFDYGYESLYGYLRAAIWNDLSYVKGLGLYIVGHGQAAPLAQLAALDLRPSKPSTKSPVTSTQVYTFSTPALGDSDFQSYFQAQVPTAWAVQAQTSNGSMIDFFPLATLPDWVQPSHIQPLVATIPTAGDDPWYERSSEFYQAAFAQPRTARVEAPRRPQLRSLSTGAVTYDPDLAYTLSLLSVYADQLYQHPNLPVGGGGTSQWQLAGNVQTTGGVTFASLFTTPSQVAVAFRGTVSWEELFTIPANYFTTIPGYLSTSQSIGQFSSGISQLYGTLRTALFLALAKLPNVGTLTLYLTGHDLGGALATLCAVDLNLAPQSLIPQPTAIYTFGALPVGDYVFQSWFTNSALNALTFRVARDYDVLPNATFTGTLAQSPSTSTPLPGVTPIDGTTFHPLDSYIGLLTP